MANFPSSGYILKFMVDTFNLFDNEKNRKTKFSELDRLIKEEKLSDKQYKYLLDEISKHFLGILNIKQEDKKILLRPLIETLNFYKKLTISIYVCHLEQKVLNKLLLEDFLLPLLAKIFFHMQRFPNSPYPSKKILDKKQTPLYMLREYCINSNDCADDVKEWLKQYTELDNNKGFSKEGINLFENEPEDESKYLSSLYLVTHFINEIYKLLTPTQKEYFVDLVNEKREYPENFSKLTTIVYKNRNYIKNIDAELNQWLEEYAKNLYKNHPILSHNNKLYELTELSKEKNKFDEKEADILIQNMDADLLSLQDKLYLSRYHILKNNFKEARPLYRDLLNKSKLCIGKEYINIIYEGMYAEAENPRLKNVNLESGSSHFRKYYMQAIYHGLLEQIDNGEYLLYTFKSRIYNFFKYRYPSVKKTPNKRKIKNIKLDVKKPNKLIANYFDDNTLITQLYYFADQGDLDSVKKLLTAGADINYIDLIHKTAILFLSNKHKKIIHYLAKHKDLKTQTINQKAINNQTILSLAVNRRDKKLIKLLLQKKVDIYQEVEEHNQDIIFHIVHLINVNHSLKSFENFQYLYKQLKEVKPSYHDMHIVENSIKKIQPHIDKVLLTDEDKRRYFTDNISEIQATKKEYQEIKKDTKLLCTNNTKLYEIFDLFLEQCSIDINKIYHEEFGLKYNLMMFARLYKNTQLVDYLYEHGAKQLGTKEEDLGVF